MVKCAISGCKSRSDVFGRKMRFFSFPKDENVSKQWFIACGKRKLFKIDCARVCSAHFAQNDFKLQDLLLKVPENKRRLKNGAVPSMNLPFEKPQSIKEKKRETLENKALVEECLASYERKQRQILQSSEVHNGANGVSESNNTSYTVNTETILEHSYSQAKFYTNGSTQTEFDYECCKELHIMRMEAQNRKLKALLKKQAKRTQEDEVIKTNLRSILTMGQVNRLLHPGRKLKWQAEDIASAMSLYNAGPKAYALLRKRNFPLPSSSTLRGWAGKIKIKPGILDSIFDFMKKFNYSEKDRLCVLCFDKIKLKVRTYSDKSENTALTRAKHAYVVMVRGLTRDWSHIIYYNLDTPITVPVLLSIILVLDAIHFVVTAVVPFMGPTTESLLEELNITDHQPYFLNPSDYLRKIFVFINVFDLAQLLKNRFVGTGFLLNGDKIDSKPIKELIDSGKCQLKVSTEHLEVDKRQKIDLFNQLFSQPVSVAIKKYVNQKIIQSPNALVCAEFVNIVNEWFGIFNSKLDLTNSQNSTKSVGAHLDEQKYILDSMSEVAKNMKTTKKHAARGFQNGILLNNSSLLQMLDYISVNYNIYCFNTARLHHEELNSFFNSMRSKGQQDHPTPLEFKYRLRSYLLGKMIL